MIQYDLEKGVEVLQFALAKHHVGTINPCQVHLTMDVSGSFDDEHSRGYTQQLINRFVPFGMLFDKDQTIGSYAFASRCERLKDITKSNFADYIAKVVKRSSVYNGGTNYKPIFEMLVEDSKHQESVVQNVGGFFSRLFGGSAPVGENSKPEKHLHFFVTDGDAHDQNEARLVLDDLLTKNPNVYFVFISISGRKLPFIDRAYGNNPYSMYLNFTPDELRNLQNLTDEDMYEMLLTDTLTTWMNK